MLKNNAILKLPSLWTHQTSPRSPHFNPSMSSSASLSRHHKNWTISAFGRGTDPVCPISIGPRRPGITISGTWANVSLLFTINLQTGTWERAQETCKGWCLHQAAQVKLTGACLSVCPCMCTGRRQWGSALRQEESKLILIPRVIFNRLESIRHQLLMPASVSWVPR